MKTTIISVDGPRRRVRITGTPTAHEWAAFARDRDCVEPWCEITLYDDGSVTSYGGEVWPSAWPEFFEPRTSIHYGAGFALTERGRIALGL